MYATNTSDGETKRAKENSPPEFSGTALLTKTTENVYYKEHQFMRLKQKFQQEKHNFYKMQQNKKCLSPFDNKRFLISKRIMSIAYGHCNTQQNIKKLCFSIDEFLFTPHSGEYIFNDSCYGRSQVTS